MSDTQIATSTADTTHATTITIYGTRMPFDVFSMTYGLLVAAGGILGYAKAGSIPSLAAGLTFGSLIAAGSYLEGTRDNYWLTFASSGVLGAMMTPRFIRGRSFASGLVSVLSIAMFLRYSIRTYQVYREKP